MNTIPFKIVAVSSNTNSFGLNQIVLVSRTGEGWAVCKSLYIPEERQRWSHGNVINVPTDETLTDRDWHLLGVEIPRRLSPDAPPKALREIWPDSAPVPSVLEQAQRESQPGYDATCILCRTGEEPGHDH